MRVVKYEANLRLKPEYVQKTKSYLEKALTPPIEFDRQIQRKALVDNGFSDSEESLDQYQKIVIKLPDEFRKQIFFLNAND